MSDQFDPSVQFRHFDRFTQRANNALLFALDEAHLLGSSTVGAEHILLGLLRDGETAAARVLLALGVELAAARAEVERLTGRGDEHAPFGPTTLAPTARRALERAITASGQQRTTIAESRQPRQQSIFFVGTEHLLVGLVGEEESVAVQALKGLGADLSQMRQLMGEPMNPLQGVRLQRGSATATITFAVTFAASEAGSQALPVTGFTGQARQALALAREAAQRHHETSIGAEHLLLGLLALGETGIAGQALRHCGVDLAHAGGAIEQAIDARPSAAANDLSLTPRTRRVIELAVDEASTLGHRSISTGHLLLALMREGQSSAATLLTILGAELERVRAEVVRLSAERNER